MGEKKRDMKRTDWKRCTEKEYKYKFFEFDEYYGTVGFLKIKKVTEPLIIHYYFGDKKIADDNYTFLEFAFRNQNFWLTAMYDDNDKLIELYFDMTNGNCFDDESNPYFYDLYLDVVVTDNEIYVVDEDELTEALNKNIISNNEYDKAINTKNVLLDYLKNNKDRLIDYCYNTLISMK